MEQESKKVSKDANTGRFVAGTSGNPAGRPVGSKNRVTNLKNEMEEYLRQGADKDKLKKVLEKMVELASEGSVGAAKLVMDKFMSGAATGDEANSGNREVRVVIENLSGRADVKDATPIDGEFTEVNEDS